MGTDFSNELGFKGGVNLFSLFNDGKEFTDMFSILTNQLYLEDLEVL